MFNRCAVVIYSIIPSLASITARASGLFIDTPSSFITPSLGAAKGDKTRYGLITETVDAFQGQSFADTIS